VRINPQAASNSAIVSTLKTGLVGRRSRGRKYWSPLSSADVNGNYTTSALMTLLAALDTAMVTYGVSGDYRLAVRSGLDHVSRTVLSAATDFAMDSMRRRLQGRGV
jgi:hypothetical protein